MVLMGAERASVLPPAEGQAEHPHLAAERERNIEAYSAVLHGKNQKRNTVRNPRLFSEGKRAWFSCRIYTGATSGICRFCEAETAYDASERRGQRMMMDGENAFRDRWGLGEKQPQDAPRRGCFSPPVAPPG